MSGRHHLPNRTIAASLVCLFDPLQVVHWKLVGALWVCGREGGSERRREGRREGRRERRVGRRAVRIDHELVGHKMAMH